MRRACLVLLASLAVVPGAHATDAPVATAQPSIAGTLQVGKKLSALTGTWLTTGGAAYAFQWYRCDAAAAHCSSIHGATRATYVEVAKDVGRTIAVTVRATDEAGTASAYAPAAGLVAPANASSAPAAQPTLQGDPIVGRALEARPGTWTGPAPTSVAYAWLRCNANGRACAAIPGQTLATYTLTANDVGRTVVAVLTAAKQAVLSVRTAVVRTAPGPLLVGAPSVTGALRVGTKLRASPGAWTSGATIAFAYQWYRCDASIARCASVHGATKPTYTTVAKDSGRTVALSVRATDATGTTTAYAPAVGLVSPAGPETVGPPLVGDPKVGTVLTAQQTSGTFAWLRCNANGRACTTIDRATSRSYTIVAADVGRTLVVAATARKRTLLSSPSAVVHG